LKINRHFAFVRPSSVRRRAPGGILLIAVLAVAGCDILQNPDEPTPIDAEVTYDALGASDTIGFGGSSPCIPLIAPPCTSGSGYVQQVTRRLAASGKEVTLNNLGVPGSVLSPEVQALGATHGLDILRNVLVDQAPYVRRTATLVTIFIGANDVNTVGRALRNGAGGANQTAYVQTQIQNFARDIQTLVTTVRSRSADARIVALNLPNMANAPYAAALPINEKRLLQQLSVGFSAAINGLTSQNVVVLDLMCDANFYNPALFSSDGFHPNDTGYNYLSELVYAAVTTTPAAPRSSCALQAVF
jgi:lysophospholipase L1-like esterase